MKELINAYPIAYTAVSGLTFTGIVVFGLFKAGFRLNGNGNGKYIPRKECERTHKEVTRILKEIKTENKENYQSLFQENTRNFNQLHEKVNTFGLQLATLQGRHERTGD